MGRRAASVAFRRTPRPPRELHGPEMSRSQHLGHEDRGAAASRNKLNVAAIREGPPQSPVCDATAPSGSWRRESP